MTEDDPLTGAGAFDRLLSRLLEEAREYHMTREALGDARGDLRKAQERIVALEAQNRLLKEFQDKHYNQAAKPLSELYAAAEAVGDIIRAPSRKGSRVKIERAAAARLDAAMRGARGFCDDFIPF